MNSSPSSANSALPLAPGERLPVSQVLRLSPEAIEEIHQLIDKFPDRLAATLPALHIAQREFGFVSLEAMKAVASALGIPESHVYGVASFYSMYQKHPVGAFHIQVCTNISCALNGAVALLDLVKKKTGVSNPREISPDGLWSVEEVECLASCGSGPCLQINHDIYDEFVNEAELDRILNACRSGQYRGWAK